ncbi:MAG: hypothetical protein WKF71_17365 [Pyrinomonadaceae bacterium]
MPIKVESNNKEGRVYIRAFHRIYRIDREIAAETFPNPRTLSEEFFVISELILQELF